MGRATSAFVGVAIALIAAGCPGDKPPGFSGGNGKDDRWSFPLVGPLEDGILMAPVMLGTHGPYLFMIDPDAEVSIIDADLMKLAGLRPVPGPLRLDEDDKQRRRAYAEVNGLELGQLIIERREVMIAASHLYDVAGRRVYGVLGRDVLADSLAFGFDRDRGLGHLVSQTAFRAPPGATPMKYSVLNPQIPNVQTLPPQRRLVQAMVGGAVLSLHVDLGATASQLRDGLWERAQLVPRDIKAVLVDEIGTPRTVAKTSEPTTATVGAVTGPALFVPYADKRWDAQYIAGTLGLGFFAAHSVWLSWHEKSLYLVPRQAIPAKERIGRWDSPVLEKCPNVGCIQTRLVDPLAGKPPAEGKPHPGIVLSITRDEPAGGMGLEVVLEAQGEPKLPYLIVNLPPHTDRLIHQLKAEFAGRTLSVVDASPHPRECPNPSGCVDQLER